MESLLSLRQSCESVIHKLFLQIKIINLLYIVHFKFSITGSVHRTAMSVPAVYFYEFINAELNFIIISRSCSSSPKTIRRLSKISAPDSSFAPTSFSFSNARVFVFYRSIDGQTRALQTFAFLLTCPNDPR